MQVQLCKYSSVRVQLVQVTFNIVNSLEATLNE